MSRSHSRRIPPGTLRIVAGSRRGRRLKIPIAAGVRPTSEKVREAVFDVLGPVGNLRVLDLFAGTGAMGLEALSRGAAHCVFVEADPATVSVLRANICHLQLEAQAQVMATDYQTALQRLRGEVAAFDLLFIDPPYRMLPEVVARIKPALAEILGPEGIAVIEGSRTTLIPELDVLISERDDATQATQYDLVFDRVYGDTRIIMLKTRRNNS